MGLWTDIIGSVRGYIRLGLTGVRLKNSSGALAVRNAGDSADASVTCANITLASGGALSFNGATMKGVPYVQDFRLTLTSGTPVTTSDVTAAGTVYACPYKGNAIALYDGTNWNIRTSAEFSLALSSLTSGKPYDVFCYDNSGAPTLEFLVWTNDTTRATALAYQDGVLVKSGAATRRYLGTFYTTGTATTEDSLAKRYLWNYYHRIAKKMLVLESTASWTYTTAAYRRANGNAANQLEFVIGVSEDVVRARLRTAASNSTGNVQVNSAIAIDSTSSPTLSDLSTIQILAQTTTLVNVAHYESLPGIGRHYLAWLEYSVATGTTTWVGNDANGIQGVIYG